MYSEGFGLSTGLGSERSKVSGPLEARPVPLWGCRLRDLSLARSVTGGWPGPAGCVEEARYQGLSRPGLSLGWGVAASGACPCSTRWRFSRLKYSVRFFANYCFLSIGEAEEAGFSCARTCRPCTVLRFCCSFTIRFWSGQITPAFVSNIFFVQLCMSDSQGNVQGVS